MIPLQCLWQNHSRAAHGKEIDTPSLGWACFVASAYAVVYSLSLLSLRTVRMQLHTSRMQLHT
jgi:hypothetical protein